ncbi:unnamed protein product, partial [marine sediment metagenome]
KPDVFVGFGGYSAGPPAVFARLARVPILIHEQNSVPGLTTRLLRHLARTVCVSDEEARAALGKRAVITGNPVRPQIAALPRRRAATKGP